MSDTPLFPDETLAIQPASNRLEPGIWVRRLVILPTLAPRVHPIQNIPLRLGLNIIRTEDRPPSETRVIGHSVGKTLFTRLLRYCLGENHFAIEAVRSRIAAKRPDAWVLAEVRVEGQTWSVARPLRDTTAADSHASQAEDCLALVGETKGTPGFAEFLRCVEAATTRFRSRHSVAQRRQAGTLAGLARVAGSRPRMSLSRLQRVARSGRRIGDGQTAARRCQFPAAVGDGAGEPPKSRLSSPLTENCLPIWMRYGRRSNGCPDSSIRRSPCFATALGCRKPRRERIRSSSAAFSPPKPGKS